MLNYFRNQILVVQKKIYSNCGLTDSDIKCSYIILENVWRTRLRKYDELQRSKMKTFPDKYIGKEFHIITWNTLKFKKE